jgi:GNAT superfamily N-acetyltransferase
MARPLGGRRRAETVALPGWIKPQLTRLVDQAPRVVAFVIEPGSAPPYSYFGIFIRDEANAIRAGLIGNCYAGWLFVALLWVHADLRGIGVGSRLMAEAERHGRDFGCHSAFVDTFTFQGPEFYPKLGYREYARLDYPPDHHPIFFCKNLDINIVKGPSQNSDEKESLS